MVPCEGLGIQGTFPSRPGPAAFPSCPLPSLPPGVLAGLLQGHPESLAARQSRCCGPSPQEDDASSLTADNLEKFGKLSAPAGPAEDGALLSEAKLQSIMSFLDEMERSRQDRPASVPQVWRGPSAGMGQWVYPRGPGLPEMHRVLRDSRRRRGRGARSLCPR